MAPESPASPANRVSGLAIVKTVLSIKNLLGWARFGLLSFGVPFLIAGFISIPRIEAQLKPLTQPNLILIVTDDQDLDAMAYMPQLRSLLVNQGLTFSNAFVTRSLCCPSRASILRGQYAHNHQIQSNHLPDGGFEKFTELGLDTSTIATWLQAAGYRTVLIGKYLNGIRGSSTYVPPGWDEWYGAVTEAYFNYKLNENGAIVAYGRDPEDYLTDVLSGKATDFIRRTTAPFFIYLTPHAPHEPAIPAPRHVGAFAGWIAPRPPSFNEADVSDKPTWIRDIPLLTQSEIDEH